MESNLYAADSNVLIYLHDSSSTIKRDVAKGILSDNPIIPTQVISNN